MKLKKSHPVPILRGITPLPGRRPLEGTPEDIFPGKYMERFLEPSITDLLVDKGVISEKWIEKSLRTLCRAVSNSEALMQKNVGLNQGHETQGRSLSALIVHPDDQKMGLNCSSEKYDSEKMQIDVVGDNFCLPSAKEMFDSSNVRPVRSKKSTPERKRISRSRSANRDAGRVPSADI